MEPFVGQIQAFGFNFAPRGWAFCDGQVMAMAHNPALVSLLGTGDVSTTRLGTGALAKYQKAAWLAATYFNVPGTAAWPAIQAAIWSFTTPTFSIPSALSTDVSTLVANANAADLSSFDFSGWSVLTPVPYAGTLFRDRQEMLVQNTLLQITGTPGGPSVVPEPQTYVLLFSGLIFMVFFGRRRMREMGYL